MSQPYRICTRCIMDTTDPKIEFDEHGACNHCREYERRALQHVRHSEAELNRIVEEIKTKGRGKEYDCVIGVSGGVDSTYVAYLVKQLGLRPLAVHMDNGWDSELAVSNIEKVLKKLGIDLYTYVLDWEEFKDLQIAFLKASVSDAEIPTDHAICAVLLRTAAKRNINYVISGTNTVTEAILPSSWTYGIWDWRYIRGIYRQFGGGKLKRYPSCSFIDRFYYASIKRIQTINILDYVPYNKNEVLHILQDELNWQYYGGKHYESIYTRFFQGYILPHKFNIDKRRAHLSTLICSGQITREEAVNEMSTPTYPGYMQEEDMDYVIKKLELSEEEFAQIISLPIKTHGDYTTNEQFQKMIYAFNIDKIFRRLRLLPARGN